MRGFELSPAANVAVNSLVEREKMEALGRTVTPHLLINSLLAGCAASMLYLESHDGRLAIWLSGVLLVNLARWAAMRPGLGGGAGTRTPGVLLRRSAIGSLATGLTWGSLPAVLLDFHTVEGPFVAIILCGLSAGAALQGGAYAAPVVAICLPILLPVATRFALLGTVGGYVLAGDVLLYIGMIVRGSRAAELAFSRMAQLRWRADALADDLKQQHEAAQAAADHLFHLANRDPLTGAANRAAFGRTLEAWLEEARAQGGAVSLVLVDLDRFKCINDTLGHGAGDEVLKTVAARLETFAGERRLVARLGGDEFALLLADPGDADAERRLADEVIEQVSAPLTVRGHPVDVGASLGLARHPADAATGEELLARADLALYDAKSGGRRSWRRFDPGLLAAVELEREIERDLPGALAEGALQVWFQPQVEIHGGRLTGFEALIRWRHPRLGWLPPPGVVAAASRLRLSRTLSRYVLEGACVALRRLEAAGLPDIRIGINISPREMADYDLLEMVTEAMAEHGIDPSRLEIEITEEAVLANEDAIATLAALRERGVRLALDDFGTGNSSIAYLRRLRMDRLKIDRSFVADVTTHAGDRALVQAIVGMGRALGVEVIAEGVETAEQAVMLSSLGCHLAQGYLYGAALSGADMATRVAEERTRHGQPRPAASVTRMLG